MSGGEATPSSADGVNREGVVGYDSLMLNPDDLEWFIKSGFEGADKLKQAQVRRMRDGSSGLTWAGNQGEDISGLVNSFNDFIGLQAKQREEYVKAKRENPGREGTILVAPESDGILL